jgi:hypothetical protein
MRNDECVGINPAAIPRPRDEHGRMLTQGFRDYGLRERSDH